MKRVKKDYRTYGTSVYQILYYEYSRKEGEREKGRKLKEIMAENLPNLEKDTDIQAHEVLWTWCKHEAPNLTPVLPPTKKKKNPKQV
jgi:hypothetical protein